MGTLWGLPANLPPRRLFGNQGHRSSEAGAVQRPHAGSAAPAATPSPPASSQMGGTGDREPSPGSRAPNLTGGHVEREAGVG